MLIKFSPVRSDSGDILIDVEGDTILVDGEVFDFGPMGMGDRLPSDACTPNPFFGNITRGPHGIELMVVLPHGANASHARRFPEPIIMTEPGSVSALLPPYDEVITPPQPESSEEPSLEIDNGNN